LVWEPARFEIAKRPDRDELYSRTFVYFNIVLLTIAVVITLFVGDFLRIVAAPAFLPAGQLVPIILIAYVLQSWTVMHNIGIQMREQTEFYTLANWVGAAVALVGYAVLIPRLLGLGAALATVASFGVREWLVYVLSQRLWPVHYRWAPVIRLLLLASAFGLVALLLPPLRMKPVRFSNRAVAPAAAPSGPRLLWRDREYEVELFAELGPERAHCEAMLLAAGLPLPVQHRTEWALVHPARTLWFVAVRAAGGGYQAGFAVDVSRSRALPGHLLFTVEKFGAALSDGARAAGLRALAHLGRSHPRVL